MKKILTLVTLSLMALNSAFSCDSPFKNVKGMTCELQYVLCSDTDIDITLCDSIKEKVEQYEKDSSEAKKQRKEISRQLKEVEKELKEMQKNPENFDDDRYLFLLEEEHRLEGELNDASMAVVDISDEFYGDIGLKLMMSEEFMSEVLKVVGE